VKTKRDWEADATPQFSSDSWKVGNFPCDEEFQRVCNSVRMQTITWKLVLFFREEIKCFEYPQTQKEFFFLKRGKKGDNNMYSLVYISDKCRPVINF
jgi:hypothetical protein